MPEYLVNNDYSRGFELEALEAQAKSTLQIEPGDPKKYEDFHCNNKKGCKWMGRKVFAILLVPALFSVACAIGRVAQLIFFGLPKSMHDDGAYIKGRRFYLQAELHQALGWLWTIINDKKGQFYIQRSDYRKSCYNAFAGKKTEVDQKTREEEEARLQRIKERERKAEEAKEPVKNLVEEFTKTREEEREQGTGKIDKLNDEIKALEEDKKDLENKIKTLQEGTVKKEDEQELGDNQLELNEKQLLMSQLRRSKKDLEEEAPSLNSINVLINKFYELTKGLSIPIKNALLGPYKERLLRYDNDNRLADFFKGLEADPAAT